MTKERSPVFPFFGVSADSPEWNDWHWQYRNRIIDAQQLAALFDLTAAEQANVATCLQHFRMAVTPYYASLIDPDDLHDPVRAQAIPSTQELRVCPGELADPLNEQGASPVPNIIHRYPDRALFLVTRCCAMYCRHCTRRRLVGEEDRPLTDAQIDVAIDYIQKTPTIKDVILSGGDPLTLSDARLNTILSRLRAIEHVQIIRIGTRIPVTLPMRVTPALLSILKKYQPIYINTHFNHLSELTPEATRACAAIVDAGIPLGNQSVLLRGVNDSTPAIKDLLLGLIRERIRPYYLYQCDLSEGLQHFRTDVRAGIQIIAELTGEISGFAIPKFVIDAPGGGGKIPLNPNYIVSIDDTKVVMRTYEGEISEYPQPPAGEK